jgi:hypothetical protein
MSDVDRHISYYLTVQNDNFMGRIYIERLSKRECAFVIVESRVRG